MERAASHLVAALLLTSLAVCQSAPGTATQNTPAVSTLGLQPDVADLLSRAMDGHEYVTAEKILLEEIDRDPHSLRAHGLLAFAGSVYYLNRDFLNAAIAWKHAEAIAPLSADLRFSLAMAYIEIGRSTWARQVLESLSAAHPSQALYAYWIGRLDYDAHEYSRAIAQFKRAISLDPAMARAYDNLGLCYYYQNDNVAAMANYKKAIELDQNSARPSPWPYLNLGIVQQFLNQPKEAESNLRTAIRLDPQMSQAHFQLGTVLEDTQRPDEAVAELHEAARLNPAYPEPHMALARILHKLGKEEDARREVAIYQSLRSHNSPPSAR